MLIGIAGPARSGKDTLANFLVTAIGGYKYSRAEPIRSMLLPFGINMDNPFWEATKEEEIPILGVSPRYMMQTLGTEWGRNLINPDLWLILAHQRLLKNGPGMIIPDIRFNNEADWVRKRKGQIIHLTRPNQNYIKAHVSENGIDVMPEDIHVVNDGSIEDLRIKVLNGFA